ncbi:MAG: hypothetical protein IKN27_03405 [Selenomonadaceae bacterium]|nr:hypothetical protein [Selenomonadaceae bacterium]
MANEILKDEILTEEQLDNVAGGTYLESADDAKKFKELGVKIYDNDIAGVPVLTHDEFVKLRGAFNKYGVTIKDNGGLIDANEYFIGDKLVSRDDAWKHIEAQLKK